MTISEVTDILSQSFHIVCLWHHHYSLDNYIHDNFPIYN